MTDKDWWEDVAEERRHWYVYDRMDSFVMGVVTGWLVVAAFWAIAYILPWVIALPAALLVGWLVGSRHRSMVIRENDDLCAAEDEE